MTSFANQRSWSVNSAGGSPSAQWTMKSSSPGYLASIDLMPSMTSAGGPQNQAFCLTPSRIEGIKSIEAKYPGLDSFMIHWAEGLGPKEFKEQLRWFAKDVMPAFRR